MDSTARVDSAVPLDGGTGSERAVRVLVVEDERAIADAIARGLRRAGMAVDVAYDGATGHEMAFVTRYDVLVLDRDLPGVHGDEICADLVRRRYPHPGPDADRERYGRRPGRGAGPRRRRLPAQAVRLRRVARPGTGAGPALVTSRAAVLTAADVVLDPAKRTVTRAGKPLDLGRKEFGLLEELIKARGAVVSTEELLERVWDANTDPFTTIVRVTMMTLRKKLGEPPLIDTVVGVGYRIPVDA